MKLSVTNVPEKQIYIYFKHFKFKIIFSRQTHSTNNSRYQRARLNNYDSSEFLFVKNMVYGGCKFYNRRVKYSTKKDFLKVFRIGF